MLDILLILLAPFIGVLVGLLPAMGAFFTIIMLYPVVSEMSPLALIIFYAVLINARDFSGSVSALNFGLLGEITSLPVLQERQLIIDSNGQKTALRNTMIGSMIGMFMGLIFLFACFYLVQSYTFLLRTDIMAVLVVVTMLFLLFWDKNKWYLNILAGAGGYFFAFVGFDTLLNKEYFTFGNVYLAGGIPAIPLILGIYVVPIMLDMYRQTKPDVLKVTSNAEIHPINKSVLLRSSLVGSVCGFVPYIGSLLSSNLSYLLEKKIHVKQNISHALNRIVASETANNASQVTVLIPFIFLGIALQPSELLVLDIIEDKGWAVGYDTAVEAVYSLSLLLPIGCLVSAFLCYNVIDTILKFFYKHYKIILATISIAMFCNIVYLGYTSNQSLYYVCVFFVSLFFGILLREKINLMPFIMCFLLQNQFHETLTTLMHLK